MAKRRRQLIQWIVPPSFLLVYGDYQLYKTQFQDQSLLQNLEKSSGSETKNRKSVIITRSQYAHQTNQEAILGKQWLHGSIDSVEKIIETFQQLTRPSLQEEPVMYWSWVLGTSLDRLLMPSTEIVRATINKIYALQEKHPLLYQSMCFQGFSFDLMSQPNELQKLQQLILEWARQNYEKQQGQLVFSSEDRISPLSLANIHKMQPLWQVQLLHICDVAQDDTFDVGLISDIAKQVQIDLTEDNLKTIVALTGGHRGDVTRVFHILLTDENVNGNVDMACSMLRDEMEKEIGNVIGISSRHINTFLWEALEILCGLESGVSLRDPKDFATPLPENCVDPIKVLLCFDSPSFNSADGADLLLKRGWVEVQPKATNGDPFELLDLPVEPHELIGTHWFRRRPLVKAAFTQLWRNDTAFQAVHREQRRLDYQHLLEEVESFRLEIKMLEENLRLQREHFPESEIQRMKEADQAAMRAHLHLNEQLVLSRKTQYAGMLDRVQEFAKEVEEMPSKDYISHE